MRFCQTVFAGAAIVAAALAVEINKLSSDITAGSTAEVEYSPDDGPTTFVLRKGDSDNLANVTVLTGT